MRLKHFFLMVAEYYAEQDEKNRMQYDLVRMQTTELININLKQSDKLKFNQLWKFPWDDENQFEARLQSMNKEDFETSYKQFLGLS